MRIDPRPFKRLNGAPLVKVEQVTQALLDSREVRVTLILEGGAKQQLFLSASEAEEFAKRLRNSAAAITYDSAVKGLYR